MACQIAFFFETRVTKSRRARNILSTDGASRRAMATRATDRFIEHLRRIVLFGHDSPLPDYDLLGRFIREREAAFEALMRRHGSMVYNMMLNTACGEKSIEGSENT